MKTQYRWKASGTKFPGPWRDTKSAAILDALEHGATGMDEQIEMRTVRENVETIAFPPSSVTSNHL